MGGHQQGGPTRAVGRAARHMHDDIVDQTSLHLRDTVAGPRYLLRTGAVHLRVTSHCAHALQDEGAGARVFDAAGWAWRLSQEGMVRSGSPRGEQRRGGIGALWRRPRQRAQRQPGQHGKPDDGRGDDGHA